MKTKNGFNIREICGEKIIVPEGKENIDFSNIISMNESAAYLWKTIQGKDFTLTDLTNLLLEQYAVDKATAETDTLELVSQWAKAGIIEGDDIPQTLLSSYEDTNHEEISEHKISSSSQQTNNLVTKSDIDKTVGKRKEKNANFFQKLFK